MRHQAALTEWGMETTLMERLACLLCPGFMWNMLGVPGAAPLRRAFGGSSGGAIPLVPRKRQAPGA
jgi:hypothetical protein